MFNLFDNLLLLSAGTPVYMGKSHAALDFFASAGFPCPPHSSAADHFLMTINQDFQEVQNAMSGAELQEVSDLEDGCVGAETADIKAAVEKLSTMLKASDRAMLQSIEEQEANPTHAFSKNKEPNLVKASAILFQRAVLNVLRNYGYVWLRLGMYIMLCICLGTIYVGLGNAYSDIYK